MKLLIMHFCWLFNLTGMFPFCMALHSFLIFSTNPFLFDMNWPLSRDLCSKMF